MKTSYLLLLFVLAGCASRSGQVENPPAQEAPKPAPLFYEGISDVRARELSDSLWFARRLDTTLMAIYIDKSRIDTLPNKSTRYYADEEGRVTYAFKDSVLIEIRYSHRKNFISDSYRINYGFEDGKLIYIEEGCRNSVRMGSCGTIVHDRRYSILNMKIIGVNDDGRSATMGFCDCLQLKPEVVALIKPLNKAKRRFERDGGRFIKPVKWNLSLLDLL